MNAVDWNPVNPTITWKPDPLPPWTPGTTTTPLNSGWVCPRCGSGVSPHKDVCPCNVSVPTV